MTHPLLSLLLIVLLAPVVVRAEDTKSTRVYIGTYGRKPGDGIHLIDLDPTTGKLIHRGLAAEVPNPSFLALSPDGRFLYAVSESGGDGVVVGFGVDAATGKLTELGRVPSGGAGPCHLAVHTKLRLLAVANYGAGSVASFRIERSGKPEPAKDVFHHPAGSNVNAKRQAGPHAHSVTVDPSGNFFVAADLGCDKLFVYGFDVGAIGKLKRHEPAFTPTTPGAGPRHFAFHPAGEFGFAINELNSTLTSYRFVSKAGTLTEVQSVSTLPAGHTGDNFPAEVRVHPSGKFVYGSNRGHDSIAVFGFDAANGKLTSRGHTLTQGKTPRNFNIDPGGKFLLAANQGTGTVVSFRIDQTTGTLTPAGSSVSVPSPVCVLFAK